MYDDWSYAIFLFHSISDLTVVYVCLFKAVILFVLFYIHNKIKVVTCLPWIATLHCTLFLDSIYVEHRLSSQSDIGQLMLPALFFHVT